VNQAMAPMLPTVTETGVVSHHQELYRSLTAR
jgi:hypothetical protein